MSWSKEQMDAIRALYQSEPEKFIAVDNIDIKDKNFNPEDFCFYYDDTTTTRILSIQDIYDGNFFGDNISDSMPMARWLAPRIASELECKNVLDIGCATGHWLSQFEKEGLEIFGLEGSDAAFKNLLVDPKTVKHFDLRTKHTEKYDVDLVLSIEVAEHIEPAFAPNYVDVLTSHSAKNIVMTAAPPGQGGEGHVNEQPKEYWIERLEASGYERDEDLENKIIGWTKTARSQKDTPVEFRKVDHNTDEIKEDWNWASHEDAMVGDRSKLQLKKWDNVWIPAWFPRNLLCFKK
jgi:SAM-dependent methyltransferase